MLHQVNLIVTCFILTSNVANGYNCSHVLASYARFLWDAGEEDENEGEEDELRQFIIQHENSASAQNFFGAPSHRPPLTAAS